MPPTFLELTVEKQIQNEIRSERYHLGTEGGTVSGTISGQGSELTRGSALWEGRRLHIESRRYSVTGGESRPLAQRDEQWELDEGNLKITVIDRRSDSGVLRRTLTYRRE